MNSLRISGRHLWARYERALQKRPVLTQMTTSALLWGLGDVLAQKVAEQTPNIDKRRAALTSAFGAGFIGPLGRWPTMRRRITLLCTVTWYSRPIAIFQYHLVGHYWYLGLDVAASKLLRPGTVPFFAGKVIADTFILGPLYVVRNPVFFA